MVILPTTTTSRHTGNTGHQKLSSQLPTGKQPRSRKHKDEGKRLTANTCVPQKHDRRSHKERQKAGQDGTAVQVSKAGLTHRFTHSHTIILRLKIVPVAAAAAIYKVYALSLGEVEVPTRHHGPAGPRHGLLGADSCVKMVRVSAGQRQCLKRFTVLQASWGKAGATLAQKALTNLTHQNRQAESLSM